MMADRACFRLRRHRRPSRKLDFFPANSSTCSPRADPPHPATPATLFSSGSGLTDQVTTFFNDPFFLGDSSHSYKSLPAQSLTEIDCHDQCKTCRNTSMNQRLLLPMFLLASVYCTMCVRCRLLVSFAPTQIGVQSPQRSHGGPGSPVHARVAELPRATSKPRRAGVGGQCCPYRF